MLLETKVSVSDTEAFLEIFNLTQKYSESLGVYKCLLTQFYTNLNFKC